MSKTYRLTQSIFSPTLYAKAGEIGEQDEKDGLWWFDNGRYYFNTATVLGNKDWFEEVKEETKSNDSFQWDDGYVELILQAATGNIKDFVMHPKEFIQDFKENWGSKPLTGSQVYPAPEEPLFSDRPIFTPKQVDAMCEDAFNAAREVFQEHITGRIEYSNGDWSNHHLPKYMNFKDYKNSKQ